MLLWLLIRIVSHPFNSPSGIGTELLLIPASIPYSFRKGRTKKQFPESWELARGYSQVSSYKMNLVVQRASNIYYTDCASLYVQSPFFKIAYRKRNESSCLVRSCISLMVFVCLKRCTALQTKQDLPKIELESRDGDIRVRKRKCQVAVCVPRQVFLFCLWVAYRLDGVNWREFYITYQMKYHK